jgi:ribosomal RNA-processing protein 8
MPRKKGGATKGGVAKAQKDLSQKHKRSQAEALRAAAQQEMWNEEAAAAQKQKDAAQGNKKSNNKRGRDSDVTNAGAKKQKGKPPSKLSKLQAKFRDKLEGGQFRWLNEKLYTTSSDEAFTMFQKKKELFEVYHKGYRLQVAKWPSNPVDVMIEELLRGKKGQVVADFGCGDAKIARTLHGKKGMVIHSFDLVAPNEFVTVCNSAKVPLEDGVANTAVFCLSLMGVDFGRFLAEANRVLKPGGVLLVAEVKSRFAGKTTEYEESQLRSKRDQDEHFGTMLGGVQQFIRDLVPLGFELKSKDLSNKMFAVFRFRKVGPPIAEKPEEGDSSSTSATSAQGSGALKIKQPAALGSCKYKKR